MSIAAVIGDITADLAPLWPGIFSLVGMEQLAKHNSPPRLVWIPTSDQFAGAQLQKVEPRPIKTKLAGLTVHVWAKRDSSGLGAPLAIPLVDGATADLDATERLVNDLIAAIHKNCAGIYQINQGRWVDVGNNQLGRAYLLDITIQIPVTMQPNRKAVIHSLPQTVKEVFPDGQEVTGV